MARKKPKGETPDAPRPVIQTAHELADVVKQQLGELWLPILYQTHIRTRRTRSIALPVPARLNQTEILHTLLGTELRVGAKRVACPDLATARYLAVFARAGCKEVAVPYDITQISHLADELESAWQRMLLLLGEAAAGRAAGFATRARTLLAQEVRAGIELSGSGPAIPQFNQNTKQRRPV